MEITVTGPHELICGKKEFQEIVAKCEEAIKAVFIAELAKEVEKHLGIVLITDRF